MRLVEYWSIGLQRVVRYDLDTPPIYHTHHPMQPDLPLRAGEPLFYGDVAWINEDGRVYRVDPRQARLVVDGLVLDNTPVDGPVELVASSYIWD